MPVPLQQKRRKHYMYAEIISIEYIPAESFIDQGYKRGQYPDAPKYYGGGGTFRTFYPSYMEVRVVPVDDDDNRVLTLIIESKDVRSITGYGRFSYRLFERIRDAAPDEIELENNGGHWSATQKSLREWFCNA